MDCANSYIVCAYIIYYQIWLIEVLGGYKGYHSMPHTHLTCAIYINMQSTMYIMLYYLLHLVLC